MAARGLRARTAVPAGRYHLRQVRWFALHGGSQAPKGAEIMVLRHDG
jgi:hypothetical protein